jgi:polyisoprenoid-binding protein YceI
MRIFLCWPIVVCFLIKVEAQNKFATNNGEIRFSSKAQLELIKAASNKLQGVIDPATNKFAFLVNMQSFQGFNSNLQRNHFNVNYVESEKFPSAKFSGKIIEQVDFSQDNTTEVRAKGELDIHGLKQTRIIKAKITIKGNQLTIESHFTVLLSDHSITIPKIVSQKIATEIEVDINSTLERSAQ